MGYHPSKDKTWWGPDGTVGEQYAFVTRTGQVSGRDSQTREFVLRLRGEAAKDAGLTYHVESSGASGSGGSVKAVQGAADGRLEPMSATLSKSVKTATIKVGVATGRWTTAAEGGQPGGLSAVDEPTGPTVFGPTLESDGGVAVTISHRPIAGQVRVVAIGKDGQEHVGRTTGGTAGQISQTTSQFANLHEPQIKRFRLQARPYQWVTFREVSIEPGYKTNVQVEVEADEAEADEAAPTPTSLPVEVADLSGLSQDKKRELAKIAVSGSHLRQLARAIWVCMPQQDGRWPDDLPWPADLRQLVEKGLHVQYDESAELLCNPYRPNMKPAYIYVKPTVPVSRIVDPGKTAVLYEAYDQWGEGINIGFLDGHVTFTNDEAWFKQLLAETQGMNATGGDSAPMQKSRDLPEPAKAGDSPASAPATASATQPVSILAKRRRRHHRHRHCHGRVGPSAGERAVRAAVSPRIWRGPTSDGDGRFVLKEVTAEQKQWIAYSQATRRIALFTLPKNAGDKPILVNLNLWEGEAEGRLVDGNGHGVAKAKVRLRVRTPDGATFLSSVLDTDKEGYYEIEGLMPMGEGLAVEVATARDADEGTGWMHRTVLGKGQVSCRDARPGGSRRGTQEWAGDRLAGGLWRASGR